MNKFFFLVYLLIFVSVVNSQPIASGSPAASNSSASTTKDIKKKDDKKGIELPPEKSAPVNVPKLGIPITIDGKLDEEVWRTAAVFKDFYQTAPGNNVAPSRPTEVYMMYDERHLYIA